MPRQHLFDKSLLHLEQSCGGRHVTCSSLAFLRRLSHVLSTSLQKVVTLYAIGLCEGTIFTLKWLANVGLVGGRVFPE